MNRWLWKTVIVMAIAQFNMNSAAAQTIESLVMPGPVTEAHAELETECSSCHEPFSRSQQRALCLDCHEDVGRDISQETGFHGLFNDAKVGRCADCHTDHEGREFNIIVLDEDTFDHDFTDRPLIGDHREAACGDCHEPQEKHRDAPSDCNSCHQDDDVHEGFVGTACDDCHKETDWLEIEFDHDTTDYELLGKHQEVKCTDCHEDKTFRFTPTTCVGCHSDDDVHNGRSGDKCENCHNPSSWTDSSFDHARDTDFVLDGGHATLGCDDCHSEDPFADTMDMSCVSCHLEDDHHDEHFGGQCDTCHTTEVWTTSLFDHDVDTEHPLIGAHETIECTDCHIEPIFEVELQSACNDCHAEDDPHEGEQGIVCKDCHNEISWQDEVFFDHDLTRFPLLGNHEQLIVKAATKHMYSGMLPKHAMTVTLKMTRTKVVSMRTALPVTTRWTGWSGSLTMTRRPVSRSPAHTLKLSATTVTDSHSRRCPNCAIAVGIATEVTMCMTGNLGMTADVVILPTHSVM